MGVGCRILTGGWVDFLPTRPTDGDGWHPPDTHPYRCVDGWLDGWLDGCEICPIQGPNLQIFAHQPPQIMQSYMPKSLKWPLRAQGAFHGEIFAEEFGFAEKKNEFEPLPKIRYPLPIPETRHFKCANGYLPVYPHPSRIRVGCHPTPTHP